MEAQSDLSKDKDIIKDDLKRLKAPNKHRMCKIIRPVIHKEQPQV